MTHGRREYRNPGIRPPRSRFSEICYTLTCGTERYPSPMFPTGASDARSILGPVQLRLDCPRPRPLDGDACHGWPLPAQATAAAGTTTQNNAAVTAIRSLVPITSMKASSLSFSIAPRPAFIEVETTVGPARARGRPRMRAVPYSDLCVSSRRSRGYEKPKRAFTGPLGSTQHRELRPAHRKRPSHRETKRASNGM